ncbi:MAG: methyltransferase domain-containing protein [Paracoccaceae bacterium]
MNPPPKLTDRAALTRNRARATAMAEPALFLIEDVADEIEERLTEVNRRFTAPAVVTGFPAFWAGRFPHATVVADDDELALDPAAHDLVIHALCLHWASDPVGQLVQCRRALKPDGLFLAALFGGQTLQELRSALAEAEAALRGGLAPRVLPMGEIRDLGALLQRAGLAMPVADSHRRSVHYSDAWALMRDLRAMGETNAMEARPRRFTPPSVLQRMAAIYGQHFPAPNSRVSATFETVFLTGWAPDPGQPKPLRPGSATHRLADALGSEEVGLGEAAAKRGD